MMQIAWWRRSFNMLRLLLHHQNTSENPIETMNSTCDYPIANTILSVSCNLEHYNISDQLQVAIVHVLNYLNVNLENNQNMWLKCLNLSGATYILHQEEIHWYEQAPIIQVSFNVAKFWRWVKSKDSLYTEFCFQMGALEHITCPI